MFMISKSREKTHFHAFYFQIVKKKIMQTKIICYMEHFMVTILGMYVLSENR